MTTFLSLLFGLAVAIPLALIIYIILVLPKTKPTPRMFLDMRFWCTVGFLLVAHFIGERYAERNGAWSVETHPKVVTAALFLEQIKQGETYLVNRETNGNISIFPATVARARKN